MIPENLVLKSGVHLLRIDSFIDYLTKKPTVRIECIDDDTCTQNMDGEWIEEYSCATFRPNAENIDAIIAKLQEAKGFLNAL